MINIFKRLFTIFQNTKNVINNFCVSIEKKFDKWQKNIEMDLNIQRIEIENKYEKIFKEYKNKKNIKMIYFSLNLNMCKMTKDEYKKKFDKWQKEIESSIIKVENKEMTYKDFFDLVYKKDNK